MVSGLPDYTRQMTILLKPEFKQQVLTTPWWLRYSPNSILHLDDMEGVLKWTEIAETVARANDVNVFEGDYALKLTTPASSNASAEAGKILGFPGYSKMMHQLRWAIYAASDTDFQNAIFKCTFASETDVVQAMLRYLHYDTEYRRKWQYYTGDGEWVDIPDGEQIIEFNMVHQHYLRFDFDPTAAVRKYSRLIADDLDLDLSALDLYSSTVPSMPFMALGFEIYTNADAAVDLYIDALCLSDNEP